MATVEGTPAADTLAGTSGDDIIRASPGADVIDGGLGADTFEAGPYTIRVGTTWSGSSHQGGVADLFDPVQGASWRITFQDVENFIGSPGDDVIHSLSYATSISGGAGNDRIGFDMDVGPSYLRGDEGDDVIFGGEDFNDLNGNQGSDTVHGNVSGDWVLGGQGDDLLFAYEAADLVYGNMGNDTCDGGAGADTVRGGQGADSLSGGAGDDWLSGDRGDDTLAGGTGADVFHSFGDAGLDRVTDFSRAEGDRVVLDPGTQYTVSQSGADVVVSMAGGAQLVLVGVPLSALTGDWISVA